MVTLCHILSIRAMSRQSMAEPRRLCIHAGSRVSRVTLANAKKWSGWWDSNPPLDRVKMSPEIPVVTLPFEKVRIRGDYEVKM
jgi:hypothetical protein